MVALELILALVVTSLARHRLGHRVWSAVHWAAYACWPLAVLHGIGTGTDTRAGWSLLLTAHLRAGGACCRCLAAAELAGPGTAGSGQTAALTAAAALVAGIAWTIAGPLSPGWARRAGTPADLLASAATGAPAAVASPVALQRGLTLALQGSLRDDGATTTVQLSDGARPPTSVTLQASDQGSSASLSITRGGVRVCSTTASVAQQIDAVCGSVPVAISLRAAGGSAVSGQLSTAGGS